MGILLWQQPLQEQRNACWLHHIAPSQKASSAGSFRDIVFVSDRLKHEKDCIVEICVDFRRFKLDLSLQTQALPAPVTPRNSLFAKICYLQAFCQSTYASSYQLLSALSNCYMCYMAQYITHICQRLAHLSCHTLSSAYGNDKC